MSMLREKIDRMLEMRRRGMTYAAIAQILGCCHETVRCRINANAREAHRSSNETWRQANPEIARAACRVWRKQNPDAFRASKKACFAAKPEYYRASGRAARARRKASKRAATLGDRKKIQAIYDNATNGQHVRCYLCGKPIAKGKRHVDHIVPLSRGGKHTPGNLAIACASCNLSKHAKMPEEMGVLF